MAYFKKIVKIINEEDFENLTKIEQKEYLIETLENFILEEATLKKIQFNENVSLLDKIIVLNNNKRTEKEVKEFNIKLIGSITMVMSKIQSKTITYDLLNTRYLINPMYTYEDNKLIYIRSYQKMNQKEVLKFLVNYLETQFLKENEKSNTLNLKK